MRILLATKSPLYRRSLMRMLGQADCEIVVVETGQETLDGMNLGAFDLCLIHDRLDDPGALDVCERLRAGSKPIIVFSTDANLESTALEKGASDFLRMPCQSQQISVLVEQWMKAEVVEENNQEEEELFLAEGAEPVDVSEEPFLAEEADPVDVADEPFLVEGVDISPIEYLVDSSLEINKALKILLVDDSQLIHSFVGNILKEYNYQVVEAYDGIEGFDKALVEKPNLIISDLDMPNMNGYEMCKKIKETEETQHIPILILSARGSGADIDKGFDVGANDYMTKPVVEHELISRLEMMLGDGETEEKRETVLVVEDSAVQRNVIIQGLEQQGFVVVGGCDGQEGLDLALEHTPDLVITDSEMPVMNGRDLARELRKRDLTKDVPILMLSAADSPLNRVKGKHAGVSAFLTKPFVPDKVVVIAEKLIGERRLLRERQALSQYVSSSALEAASAAADVQGNVHNVMRADERFVTVFFTDIVGFTPLTERLEPQDLVFLLNEYFDAVAPIFKENGGIIDKFVGDAIMALFVGESESEYGDAAYRAVKTGLEMIDALNQVNAGRDEAISVRVGINSGPVIMGDIGSRLYRRDYTVIGDNVNIAARLEASAGHGSVMISDSTYQLVLGQVDVETLEPIMVKGKSEPIQVYQAKGLL